LKSQKVFGQFLGQFRVQIFTDFGSNFGANARGEHRFRKNRKNSQQGPQRFEVSVHQFVSSGESRALVGMIFCSQIIIVQ
jgi:hypothetical protein